MSGQWMENVLEKLGQIGQKNGSLPEKFKNLCRAVSEHESALVAYSGGVDSSLLAFVSSKLLDRCLCVLWDSPLIPRSEVDKAKGFAGQHGLDYAIIDHDILEDAGFRANEKDRCFICKDRLLKSLAEIRDREGLETIFEGSNADDLGDFRPGRRAVEINNAESPLLEAGMSKEDIRDISKILELETWDKPSMACLASRIPWGSEISKEMLAVIEKAEELLRAQGHRQVRVRCHGDLARIELGLSENLDLESLSALVPKMKGLGFKYVVLDIEGYRTGSLND